MISIDWFLLVTTIILVDLLLLWAHTRVIPEIRRGYYHSKNLRRARNHMRAHYPRASAVLKGCMRGFVRLIAFVAWLHRVPLSLTRRLLHHLKHLLRFAKRLLRVAKNELPFLLVRLVTTPFYFLWIVRACVLNRAARMHRRAEGVRPRLVWGPYPNASALAISRALHRIGYECDTIVYYNFDRIWDASEFTFVLTELKNGYSPRWERAFGPGWWRNVCRTFLHPTVFLRVVENYDIVHGFFYAGYLRDTWLCRLEPWFLHLAGCKIVTLSIGGDVAALTDIRSLLIRQGYNDFYPHLTTPKEQKSIRYWIDFYSRHSDYIICQCSYMIDALPRWDLLTTQYFPIDTDFWSCEYLSNSDGRNGVVRIGHSPNHRPLKGTNFLIRAVNELRAEGLKIELCLIENKQNREVRNILAGVDIVFADLVLQGYSYMAMEGLALGKPVLQDISDPHYNRVFKLYTGLDAAPFVSVPLEQLKEALRSLVVSPQKRRDIGAQGRAYVLKHHSYDAACRFWEWIYEYLWFRRRPRVAFYNPDWPISPILSLNAIEWTALDHVCHAAVYDRLERFRAAHPQARLGFFPYNLSTDAVIEALVRTRCIRSEDYLLVRDTDTVPKSSWHHAQASISASAAKEFDLTHVCVVTPGRAEDLAPPVLEITAVDEVDFADVYGGSLPAKAVR